LKLKERPSDFRVLEVLRKGLPSGHGRFKIYRVTKTKFTTLEAADLLAAAADVEKSGVAYAGLKDRQGVTMQYFSVEGGGKIKINEPGFQVEYVGDSDAPVDSTWLEANAFDITARELNREDIRCFKSWKYVVKSQGVPNYFDDQRFGSLRHGQGFIVREMMDGNIESALKRLLLYPSPFDPPRDAAFKGRLRRAWGDFELCVKLCRGGKHLSVFEHLAGNPKDFAGAFRFVSRQIRLIHLYSYQSYLWNLSAAAYLRRKLGNDMLISLPTDAGPVVAWKELPAHVFAALSLKTLPLLAPDVKITDPEVRGAVDEVLQKQGITLERLRVPGVEGFAFKAEERALVVIPRHLRVMAPDDDEENPGFYKIRMRFELPRGSYATLMMKRLFANAKVDIAKPAPEAVFDTPEKKLLDRGIRTIPERRVPDAPSKPRKGVPRSPIRESGDLPEGMRPPAPKFEHPRSFRDRDRGRGGAPGGFRRPPFGGPRFDRKPFGKPHPGGRPHPAGPSHPGGRFFEKKRESPPPREKPAEGGETKPEGQ
jgi:tRNA pseudouridine13 synthase